MSEKRPVSDEERANHRFSFVVGIIICIAIFAVYTIFYYSGFFK